MYNGDCDLWSDVGGENILAAVTMVLPGGAVTVWSTSEEMVSE